MRSLLIVLSGSVSPERDEAYNDWYTNVHLPDVLAVPGYVRATRYKAFPGERSFDQEYMALYELEVEDLDALRAVSDEHMRRIEANEMHRSPPDTIDRENVRSMYYIETGPRLGDHDDMPETVFMPFTESASKEEDEEFNRWYQEVHLPEVLGVPGFSAASRYKETGMNMTGRPWPIRFPYLAVYELADGSKDAFDAAMKELRRRITEGDRMEISDTLGSEKVTQVYKRITDRIVAT